MKWVLVMSIESKDGETIIAKSVTDVLSSKPLMQLVVDGGVRLVRNLRHRSDEIAALAAGPTDIDAPLPPGGDA